MDKLSSSGDGIYWWWGLASAAQLTWGIRSYSKGLVGNSQAMPFKAFAIASLFVGSAASASIGILHLSGIHNVDDIMQVGGKMRTRLGMDR